MGTDQMWDYGIASDLLCARILGGIKGGNTTFKWDKRRKCIVMSNSVFKQKWRIEASEIK